MYLENILKINIKLGMMLMPVYQDSESRGNQIQFYLCNEFQASQGYTERPCLKNNKQKMKRSKDLLSDRVPEQHEWNPRLDCKCHPYEKCQLCLCVFYTYLLWLYHLLGIILIN